MSLEVDCSEGIPLWPLVWIKNSSKGSSSSPSPSSSSSESDGTTSKTVHVLWPCFVYERKGFDWDFFFLYLVFRLCYHPSRNRVFIDFFWPIFHFEFSISGVTGIQSNSAINFISFSFFPLLINFSSSFCTYHNSFIKLN